jgi:hypothetical protein
MTYLSSKHFFLIIHPIIIRRAKRKIPPIAAKIYVVDSVNFSL